MSSRIRQTWSQSRAFRVILVIGLIYAPLRLAVHGAYLVIMSSPGKGMGSETPDWAGAGESLVPVDLQVYLDAAAHFRLQRDLYLKEALDSIEYHYPYPPAFAMIFVPFLWLPPLVVSIVHTLLHIGAHGLLYIWWGRIFRRTALHQAREMLVWTLPIWLVFAAFWSDLAYLNIYVVLALLATLLADAILNERLGWALLWLSIILQTKPMWAVFAAIPLLLGRYRLFIKLLALAVVTYAAIAGLTILVAGTAYGWRQYADYFHLLSRLGRDFPWRGPDAPFLGYNHSIKQIVVFLLGVSPQALGLATFLKVLLLAPLGVVSLRHLLQPARQAGRQVPLLSLDLGFALYLGAFIWLDIVWEVSLGIAVFTYLLATSEHRCARTWLWCTFLPYALVDLLQVAGVAVFGLGAVLPGPYILTDPSIYIPLIMIVILTFYALLIRRLWASVPRRHCERVLAVDT